MPNLVYSMPNSFSPTTSRHRLRYFLVWLLLVSPVGLVTLFSFTQMKKQVTALVLSRREAIASLTAVTVQEKLDRVVDLAKSMAGRTKFRQAIAAGDWDEAIRVIATVPQEFTYVDQILVTDPTGDQMADAPKLLGSSNKNFSAFNWYQGVSSSWKPYVSSAYSKGEPYRRNVIGIAVPVLADNESINAILVLEVRLEKVLEWIRQVDVGQSGFVYVTDQKGQLLAHPRFSPQGDLTDFSLDPAVQRALKGMQGVGIDRHPVENEDRISAYTMISKYRWAVVVTQPSNVAFIQRNEALQNLFIIYGIFFILTVVLASAIIRSMITQRRSEEVIRNLSLTDELTGLYNRRGFLMLAEEQLKLARRSKMSLTLFFADMDGLKGINDQFGHKEGDLALIDTANILRDIFREGDIIARFAGDEYAVLVVSDTKVDNDFFMNRLTEYLHKFNLDGGRRYALSLSVGHSQFDPQKNPSVDELMSMADAKLYELKGTRKILDVSF